MKAFASERKQLLGLLSVARKDEQQVRQQLRKLEHSIASRGDDFAAATLLERDTEMRRMAAEIERLREDQVVLRQTLSCTQVRGRLSLSGLVPREYKAWPVPTRPLHVQVKADYQVAELQEENAAVEGHCKSLTSAMDEKSRLIVLKEDALLFCRHHMIRAEEQLALLQSSWCAQNFTSQDLCTLGAYNSHGQD